LGPVQVLQGFEPGPDPKVCSEGNRVVVAVVAVGSAGHFVAAAAALAIATAAAVIQLARSAAVAVVVIAGAIAIATMPGVAVTLLSHIEPLVLLPLLPLGPSPPTLSGLLARF